MTETSKEVDPSIKANETAKKVLNRLWFLIGATLVLYVVIGGLAAKIYSVSQENTEAICAVRAESEKRSATSKKFLEEHPRGISGISPAVLRRGIDSADSTVKALSTVDCPAPPAIPGTGVETETTP